MKNSLFKLLLGMLLLIRESKSEAATLAFNYDSLSRITNVVYSDGSRESYSYDPAGNRLSRLVSVATNQVDVAPPSKPTNLVLLAFSPSQLSIRWNRSYDTGGSGLAGYQIFVNNSLVATTSGTNFVLSGLMPSTQYCLNVAAYDHSGNVSLQGTNVCVTTPVFQPPFLSALGFVDNQFEIGISSGTSGPYDVLVSTNLISWQPWTNLVLPAPGNVFFDSSGSGFKQRFYQLRWSTNSVTSP